MKATPGQPAAKEQSGVLTQAQMIRLECLRLVYSPVKDAPYLIGRAVEFEKYVRDGEPKGAAKAAETIRQDGPDAPD